MAPLKRKRKPTRTTANKRPKYTQPDTESSSSCNSSSEEEGDNHDSQIEWEALRILEQKGHGFGLQYLIAWKGIDPATGEQWSPTWERFSNASESLRASWKEERARRLLENTDGVNSAQHHGFPEAPQVQAVQTRASRRRRIVESYEIPTSASSINSPTEDNRPAVTAPSTVTLDIDASTSVWTPSQANIDSRGNISSRSESELPTEIPESLPSSPKRVAEETDFGSSPLFASEHTFHASGIVPDTQSSIGDTSYIPVTQEELDSSLHSDTTDKSTEGNIVENSVSERNAQLFYEGVLIDVKSFFDADAPPRLGARAQSPATSIAETVADTTQDLQSQRQLESQQEQLELPETLGSPAASTRSGYRVTQNDRSSQHTDFVTARPRSPFNQHKSTSPDRTLFVENTTHLDHEASSNHLQTFSRGQDRSSTSEVLQRDLSSTYERPVASLAFSEALVVADTPQISQLTSTAQEGATNEDQTDAAPQAEISQQSVDETDPTSLTEYSVLEENAQFPFHSQYSAFFDIRSIKPTEQASANPVRSSSTTDFAEVRLSEELSSSLHQERSAYNESEESTTIDEISQSPLPQGPHLLAHADSQNSCQLSPTIEQSTDSREYNAQCVHSSARLSTQDDTIESLKDTVEVEPGARASPQQRSSPFSRHDSSQETPERHLQSGECSSSIPHPPSYSLRTLDSNVPPRPATPIPGSSLSKMTETSGGGADLPESTAAKIDRQLRELQEADRLANPYTPRRQRTRVFRPPSTASATVDATGPVSQLKNEPAPPVIHISAEGTRSPSTVPDRSPAPPAPTSLRTVALANAKERATEILPEKVLAAAVTTTEGEPAQARVDLFAAEAGAPTKQVGSPRALALDTTGERSDVEDHDDVSDDESFYDDSLELEHNEFVVPLFIEGRQKDTYTAYIDRNKTLLNNVVFQLEDSVSIESELLESAENLLTYMKAVETHPDLIYAEAESATRFETQSATDVQHGAQFGIENSVKFKFLHELFNHLREEHVHVVLLLDQENDALLNILMNSFAAASLDFKMPTKGYQSHASDDALTITIFPSVASLVLRPADLTICLDGVQSAAKIRESNWAMASGKPVPVLHLVIPQTAGHIERYIPATKKKTNRIWTILNGLAQISRRFELGKPIDEETPKAAEAARLIASWLLAEDDGPQTEWPLPSIGNASFLDDDESQDYVASVTTSPAPERTKRPLVSTFL